MISCKDFNNKEVKVGDKILYIKSGSLEKATVVSIGRETLVMRRDSDKGMGRLTISVDPNKHIIKYDWNM